MNHKILLILSLFFGLFAHNQAWSQAVSNDREQPVEIEANQMQADEQTGVSIYIGDVIAVQGSLKVTGEKMDITHPNNELQKIIAIGQPAEFESFLVEQNAWVKGKALTIIYYAEQQKIELIGEAFAEQENKHTITGDKIVYDLDTQILNASSDQPNKRIKMVLTPESETSNTSKEP